VLHISIWGKARSFVSEGLTPPKLLSNGDGTVWQNFSLLFNAIDSKKYVKLARYAKLSFYKHDRASAGLTIVANVAISAGPALSGVPWSSVINLIYRIIYKFFQS